MKKNHITLLLTLSILINIYQFNGFSNTSDITIGLASTFDLLFESIEQFDEALDLYNKGEIDKETLKEASEYTSFTIYKISNIFETYNIKTMLVIEGLDELETYFRHFGGVPDEYKIEAFNQIKITIRKNHALSVPSYYNDYPNLSKNQVPDAFIHLFTDFKAIASESNHTFEENLSKK